MTTIIPPPQRAIHPPTAALIAVAALVSLAGAATMASAHSVDASGAEIDGPHTGGKEYLLTVTRPNDLQVIDMTSNELVRSCEIPGPFGSGIMSPAPDGRVVYILSNLWQDIIGIDIQSCEVTFHAAQSSPGETVKSFQSVAVSADGTEVYTVQNPTQLKLDHFEVLEPRLAVFNVADGLDAKAVRTFPVDRRITKIVATDTGDVILGGGDLKAIDPNTGDTRLVMALQNWDRGPRWSTPDAFAMHTQGGPAHEYIMPYSTAEFADDNQDMASANWWWGIARVDLATGEAERMEIAPLSEVIMNFATDPTDDNTLYGVFNGVHKIDIANQTITERYDLPHTYYTVNVSRDGKTVYAGGTSSDISVHRADTLEKIKSIQLPGDMSTTDMRVAYISDPGS
ncbi:quinohemoprotein amine dehydrogenase subunit beta [Halomonas sp. V046]|uniref:quinohemoprotein amine dehydrogenase subunit beta n=1 Tax=Halomonas sp. V046 TaxID=3459611 RepID=UPI004044B9FC